MHSRKAYKCWFACSNGHTIGMVHSRDWLVRLMPGWYDARSFDIQAKGWNNKFIITVKFLSCVLLQ